MVKSNKVMHIPAPLSVPAYRITGCLYDSLHDITIASRTKNGHHTFILWQLTNAVIIRIIT